MVAKEFGRKTDTRNVIPKEGSIHENRRQAARGWDGSGEDRKEGVQEGGEQKGKGAKSEERRSGSARIYVVIHRRQPGTHRKEGCGYALKETKQALQRTKGTSASVRRNQMSRRSWAIRGRELRMPVSAVTIFPNQVTDFEGISCDLGLRRNPAEVRRNVA